MTVNDIKALEELVAKHTTTPSKEWVRTIVQKIRANGFKTTSFTHERKAFLACKTIEGSYSFSLYDDKLNDDFGEEIYYSGSGLTKSDNLSPLSKKMFDEEHIKKLLEAMKKYEAIKSSKWPKQSILNYGIS